MVGRASNLDLELKEFWGRDGFSRDEIQDRFVVEDEKELHVDLPDYEKKVYQAEEAFFNMSKNEIKDLKKMKTTELLEKIETLKGGVFNLKSKLFLLSEATFKNKIVSSGLQIEQKNELGELFRGETLTYLLDNKEILTDVFIEKNNVI